VGEERQGGVEAGFDRGWDGHARRQARRGLAMTPAERLRWLEETMEAMRRIQGRAIGAPRRGARSRERGDSPGCLTGERREGEPLSGDDPDPR